MNYRGMPPVQRKSRAHRVRFNNDPKEPRPFFTQPTFISPHPLGTLPRILLLLGQPGGSDPSLGPLVYTLDVSSAYYRVNLDLEEYVVRAVEVYEYSQAII